METRFDDPQLETAGDFSDTIAWWNNKDLTEHQWTVKKIHYELRYHTDLGPGSCRDYVKALNRIIVDGEDVGDVPNGTAAMKHAERIMNHVTIPETKGGFQ